MPPGAGGVFAADRAIQVTAAATVLPQPQAPHRLQAWVVPAGREQAVCGRTGDGYDVVVKVTLCSSSVQLESL